VLKVGLVLVASLKTHQLTRGGNLLSTGESLTNGKGSKHQEGRAYGKVATGQIVRFREGQQPRAGGKGNNATRVRDEESRPSEG